MHIVISTLVLDKKADLVDKKVKGGYGFMKSSKHYLNNRMRLLKLGDIPVLYRYDNILFTLVSINFIPENRYTVEYWYNVKYRYKYQYLYSKLPFCLYNV